MDSFLKFLSEYKELLLSALCLVLTLVCILVKRKPKTLDEFLLCLTEVLNKVPEFIISVERDGNGEEKKLEVINLSCDLLKSLLGRDLTEKESSLIEGYVSREIEIVLSTPRKKDIKL